MQEGVQEPVRMILLTFIVILLINVFGITYRINQINEYQRRMEQDIQVEGGVTEKVLGDGDILSKNVYQDMFELQRYPGDLNSGKVNDYGKQVRYQIKIKIPFLFYGNSYFLHYYKQGQVASQHDISQKDAGVKIKTGIKMNTYDKFTGEFARKCLADPDDLPNGTVVEFAYHNYKYDNDGDLDEVSSPMTNKVQIRDAKGTYYWMNVNNNEFYSYVQPRKALKTYLKPGHYQATIRITYPKKNQGDRDKGQNQNFEYGTTEEKTVNIDVE